MAHTKAGGSRARQGGNVGGKRLGFKVSDGQPVKTGQILVRQRGQTWRPGENVRLGRDFTLYSLAAGKAKVSFFSKSQKQISVLPQSS